jgi:hypothetical protein
MHRAVDGLGGRWDLHIGQLAGGCSIPWAPDGYGYGLGMGIGVGMGMGKFGLDGLELGRIIFELVDSPWLACLLHQ